MNLNLPALQKRLCDSLCGEVQVRKTKDGALQVVTPFYYGDGDSFELYIEEGPAGSIKLTDYGMTMMHLSYERDVTALQEGARGKLFDQILASSDLYEEDGKMVKDATLENLGSSILEFGQALTRVHDLSFLDRERVSSAFSEDLKRLLFQHVPKTSVQEGFVVRPGGEDYKIDFRIETKRAPLFLFGIQDATKAMRVTIVLQHWIQRAENFDSLIVFQDQSSIPRGDLARLSNVAGTQIASLEAEPEFARKIERALAP
jgi:hypothetical protein